MGQTLAVIPLETGKNRKGKTVRKVAGLSRMTEYREAAVKLRSVEMIRYEEKLRQAKDDCKQRIQKRGA